MAVAQFLTLLHAISGFHLALSQHWNFIHANPQIPESYNYFNDGHNFYSPPPPHDNRNYLPPRPPIRNNTFQTTQRPSASNPATENPRERGCGLAPNQCPNSKYRTYDGSCNNLENPVWGTPQTPYARLLPAIYSDGVSSPPTSSSGGELPNARIISLYLHPDVPVRDPRFTLAAMQFGQIVTHDMSMIAGSTQAQPHMTSCCSNDGKLLDLANSPEHCFPLVLPENDPIYSRSNTECKTFLRSITDGDRGCVRSNQAVEQLTAVNAYLDLSLTYGNNDLDAQALREGSGGRMITVRRNGQDWPPQVSNVSGTCDVDEPNEPCYLAGDTRVNQNPQLTILQIIFMREHNRISEVLSKLNPHWDDEKIFQEARSINIGQFQQITYYEWLPLFLGVANSIQHKLIYPGAKGFINDYDETVNPSILNEHANGAFRYFHTLIAGYLDLLTERRNVYGNLRLSDWYNKPSVIEGGNSFDDLTRGMGTQPQLKADQYWDSEVTQFLFKGREEFGDDLRSIDIQRNRDHGLASYNDYRSLCGLPVAHSFEDFADVISQQNVGKLAALYESPNDVDLSVGAFLERHVRGTLAGPTFLCILIEQFYRTRKGDRYFFENGQFKRGFTDGQLKEIRKATISRLLCDNGRDIKNMQARGFERVSEHNPIVPCEALPIVDLTLWREDPVSESFPDFDFLFYATKK